ncbi:zeta toxin family protein [Dongia sp.]|uniref:zeta toxin family protein n=1 Tax=Dongia sp. TaxID=1977262 RepID=UPI003751CA0A
MAKKKKASSSKAVVSGSSINSLKGAVDWVSKTQRASGKPLAIVLAGHNGSGKSTLWYKRLAPVLKMPLVNADRLMMSILPEQVLPEHPLPKWAQTLRDKHEGWMRVSQQGVQAFVAQAMSNQVPFAMETVFSHWKRQPDGSYASKIDSIRDMQKAGYYVLLVFVGLTNADLSRARVASRVYQGGHAVPDAKLKERFPRTQAAIRAAIPVADASILVDNSGDEQEAFTVCRVQARSQKIYDCRASSSIPKRILLWLEKVATDLA